MAPVVHGLEKQYSGKVDFLYLNVADARNTEAKRTFGFVSTPHFFFLRRDGSPVRGMQGVLPADTLRRALDGLLAEPPTRTAR
jgi:thioredoxin-like negative regulator of GroEL